jgi:hypothetical protein
LLDYCKANSALMVDVEINGFTPDAPACRAGAPDFPGLPDAGGSACPIEAAAYERLASAGQFFSRECREPWREGTTGPIMDIAAL